MEDNYSNFDSQASASSDAAPPDTKPSTDHINLRVVAQVSTSLSTE